MKITRTVKKILDNYESDNPGTKGNLARILMHGRLGGSGKMVILPVDQGFEHGPARSRNDFLHSSRRHAADWGGQMRPQDGVPLPAAVLFPYIATVTRYSP